MALSFFPRYYKYIYPILFIIPLNFFIIGNGIGFGAQWAFFRYQITLFGTSFIPLTSSINYITRGTLTGRSAHSELLMIIAAICLIVAFIILLSNHAHALKISGLITIASGILLLASSMVQYGVLLHGDSGESIPIGVPLILVFGACMIIDNTWLVGKSDTLSFLKKYDFLLLFIGIFVVYYLHSTIVMFSNDTVPNQLLPYFILHDHTLYLDQATTYISNTGYGYRFVDTINGHYVSLFPIVTPVLVLPLYVIPITILNIPMTDVTLLFMGKLSAALISSLACVFIFLSCKTLSSYRIAIVSTLIFAFATSTWSISSQALWAHCMVELLLSIAIYIVVRNEYRFSHFNIVALGIISGLFVFNRPSDAILILPVILYVLKFYQDKFRFFLVSACMSGAPFLIYNLFFFGNPFGGYMPIASRLGFSITTAINYVGLIVAPNKGLLVFSPVLILSLIGFLVVWKNREDRLYTVLRYFIPVILFNLLIYALFDDWIGGSVFGPRYLTAILPVLAIGVCLGLKYICETGTLDNRMKTTVLVCVGFLVFVSVMVQITGVYFYPAAVNSGLMGSENYDPWSVENSIIVNSIVYGYPNIFSLNPVIINDLPSLEQGTGIEPGKILLSEKVLPG